MQPLSTTRLALLIGYGAVLWLGAALLIAALHAAEMLTGLARAWLYLAVIPGTLPFVFIARRIARGQAVLALAIATATATWLDGVALAWWPLLYGADSAAAAAVLLWGAGVGLALAVMLDRSARSTH